MSSIVDGERLAKYEEELKNEYDEKSKAEKNDALEAYAKEVYGPGAKVKDNKVIYYEDGVKKEAQITKEQLAKQMIAADATEKAAAAME
jgi:hypothetical protein